MLRGEKTEAVLRHGHDRLPTFGLGADHAPAYWRGLVRQLIGLGVLDIDTEGHGGLFLVSDKARPILRGEQAVMLREAGAARPRRVREAVAVAGAVATAPVAEGIFAALRAWRAAEAKAQAIPPYVIFHDSVLREIAAVRPQTLGELGDIKGVGASKLQRYGARVLTVLAQEAR